MFIPPPVRGMGDSGGFSMRLQDRAGMARPSSQAVARQFIAEANQTPGIAERVHHLLRPRRRSSTSTSTATRRRCSKCRSPTSSTPAVYLGSAYVNDFNMFGRTCASRAGRRRVPPAIPRTSRSFKVRSTRRARWCRSAAGRRSRRSPAPIACRATTCSRPPRSTARRAPGVSSGQALEIMASSSARELRTASPSSGPTCPTRRTRPAAPATTCSRCRAVRVPGAGRAVRELVAAAGHHADRADVPALLGAVRRHAARAWTTTSSRRSASSC